MSEWLGDLGAKWRQDRDRVRGLWTQGAMVTRPIKDLFQDTGLNLDLGNTGEPLMIDWDRSRPGAAVVLDPGAQQLLDPRGDRQSEPPPDFCEIFVLLSWAGPERDTGQVAVRAGDHRVGVLAAADSAAFRSFLEQGSQLDRPVITEAFRDRAPDDSWRLTVYQPSTTS
ncbi:MAG TPA: hypothetical protein VF933_38775 [Streptosporangiaceae bacterium]